MKINKIIGGELILLAAITLAIMAINLIPTKLAVESIKGMRLVFPMIGENTFIKNEITADNNYFNRIDILFKNPNLESRDELLIELKSGNKVVASQAYTGFNFGDTSRARLDFSPIVDSKGQKFDLRITTTKIVDGKLGVGMDESGNLDTVMYFQNNFNIKNAIANTIYIWQKIIVKQPIVIILPMILCGIILY